MTLSLPWDWLDGADGDPVIRAIQDNFERIAKQFPVANEQTQTLIVHGTVASDGTVGTGSGFTSSTSATGTYNVAFDPPFNDTPTVVANVGQSSDSFIVVTGRTTTDADFLIKTVGATPAAIDRQFEFIAIGAR